MIPEQDLRQMYCDEQMSLTEIAKEICVDRVTVFNWMKKHGIETRTISESRSFDIPTLSKKELEKMYIDDKRSQKNIAEEFGVHPSTVSNWMKIHRIKARTCSESLLVNSLRPPKSELEEMYHARKMTFDEISNEIGVSIQSISNWLQLYEIEPRVYTSFEPYCEKFNNKFKESVRKRDDYICQLCGHEQISGGHRLSVHHIHYDKSDCWPDVVALCNSCNSKVNADREYWEQYFENQLSERGLMCWSITQEA